MLSTTRLAAAAATALLVAALPARSPAQTTAPSATLGVGDAAPALHVTRWYKGTPIPAFQPGQIYVVEFWATWCGPCKVSIPHLTALQKQYAGKVTVIGVDILEVPEEPTDQGIATLVEPFVKKMGDQMAYTVAGDGTDRFMAEHWQKAAGTGGIPTAFVVMPDGKIGWIGHPLGLDRVLPQVVAGTWDAAGERRRRDDLATAAKPHMDALRQIMPAVRAKDWARVIAARDQALATSPDLAKASDLVSYGLQAELNSDPRRALADLRALFAPGGLVASDVVTDWAVYRVLPDVPATGPMTAADWQAVAAIVGPNVDHSAKKGYGHLTGYADILWRAGDPGRAKVYQQRGVRIIAAWNEAHKPGMDKGNVASIDKQLKDQQDRLAAMSAGRPFAAATTQPVGATG